MRILLDESLPRRLINEIPEHSASTVTENGWSGLENGELLRAAAARFDVFLTADQNIEYHSLLDKDAPDVDLDLAVFMYGACASFAAYLVNKTAKCRNRRATVNDRPPTIVKW